jgi:hypothetical protein
MLVKQAHYCLSSSSIPFWTGYFGDGGPVNFLPRLVSNGASPNISLPSSQDYRHETKGPSWLDL